MQIPGVKRAEASDIFWQERGISPTGGVNNLKPRKAKQEKHKSERMQENVRLLSVILNVILSDQQEVKNKVSKLTLIE